MSENNKEIVIYENGSRQAQVRAGAHMLLWIWVIIRLVFGLFTIFLEPAEPRFFSLFLVLFVGKFMDDTAHDKTDEPLFRLGVCGLVMFVLQICFFIACFYRLNHAPPGEEFGSTTPATIIFLLMIPCTLMARRYKKLHIEAWKGRIH